MHICHVVAGVKGGPEILLRQLTDHQLAQGHKVTLIFSPVRDPLEVVRNSFQPQTDLVMWTVGREVSFADDIKAFKELDKILGELKPDVVHLHSSKAGAIGRPVCRRHGLASIYSPHGLPFLRKDVSWAYRVIFYTVEWLLALLADYIVPCSPGEARAISAFPARKVLIVNSLDTNHIRAEALRGAPVPRDGRFRVALASRIEPAKNPELVVELSETLPPDWEWVWIGDGVDQPIVEKSGRFHITGWLQRHDVLATVASCDVYLQASRWEGMSFALLEAMTLGRPCVVSNVPGNQDAVIDGVSGYICSDKQGYIEALTHLREDADARTRMGAAARLEIETTFEFAAVRSRWDELYGRAVKAQARRT